MASAGAISIKVVPDLSEFREQIEEHTKLAGVVRRAAHDLLFQYSEWLDSEGVIRGDDEGDVRSHDQLVRDFLTR